MNVVCAICQEGLDCYLVYPTYSQDADRHKCRKHVFHFMCLAKWFKRNQANARCPLCNRTFDKWVCQKAKRGSNRLKRKADGDKFLNLVDDIHNFENLTQQLEFFQQLEENRMDWFLDTFALFIKVGRKLKRRLTTISAMNEELAHKASLIEHFATEFRKLDAIELKMKYQLMLVMQYEKLFK